MCVENGWSYFKYWWKSFTIKEKILTIIEAILLVSLIVLIVIVIFHFLFCKAIQNDEHATSVSDTTTKPIVTPTNEIPQPTALIVMTTPAVVTPTDFNVTATENPIEQYTNENYLNDSSMVTTTKADDGEDITSTTSENFMTYLTSHHRTKKRKITCTANSNVTGASTVRMNLETTTANNKVTSNFDIYNDLEYYNDDLDVYPNHDFYGELDTGNENIYKNYLAAFVKLSDMKLGCPLTLISKFWTLTAASCIENIKNVQPIYNFEIIEYYHLGEVEWKSHSVADLKIHPRFRGFNRSYDVAVLKTEDEMKFVESDGFILPTMYEFLMLNIGDKLNIMGYGVFRNNTKKYSKHSEVIQTRVFVLPRSQCPYSVEEYEEISLRNLKVGPSMDKKDKPCCQETTICAGVLFRRKFPCYFCSGTPLFKGKFLMGIMGDNEECGNTCEPMHYVNVASIVDWLKFVMKM